MLRLVPKNGESGAQVAQPARDSEVGAERSPKKGSTRVLDIGTRVAALRVCARDRSPWVRKSEEQLHGTPTPLTSSAAKGRRAMLREAMEKEEKEAEERRKEAEASERENVRRLNAMESSM